MKMRAKNRFFMEGFADSLEAELKQFGTKLMRRKKTLPPKIPSKYNDFNSKNRCILVWGNMFGNFDLHSGKNGFFSIGYKENMFVVKPLYLTVYKWVFHFVYTHLCLDSAMVGCDLDVRIAP